MKVLSLTFVMACRSLGTSKEAKEAILVHQDTTKNHSVSNALIKQKAPAFPGCNFVFHPHPI